MPSARIGDATLHYRESGTGSDALLFLHAFPLHSGMWEGQLTSFAPRFRVIAPDYRGMGLSRPAPAVATMELLVSDLLMLLRQLGIRRVGVAGLSMGGYVALELYRRAPGVVRGLALCATKATPDTVEARATREASAENALAKGLDSVANDFAPKLLRPDPAAEVLARVKALIREGTKEGVAAAQRGMARRVDSVPTLARIACPTLAVAGEQDQLMPGAELRRIAQTVRGGRLVTISGAGHLPNLEAPSAFNSALGSFFATLPA
jgi:pimeloyl-ACP methyl ester carboxylesterase